MSDSNWLHSTLAQSTAAMVAVGVAFFVPRLQELQIPHAAHSLPSVLVDERSVSRTPDTPVQVSQLLRQRAA